MKVNFDELPEPIKQCMLDKQIDFSIDRIENAGLLEEFSDFVIAKESIENFDELCIEFAKKYPDKFSIVPPDQRYDFCVYNDMK